MVRMNTRAFIRKSKKNNKRSDPRHAGMSFYIDLDELFTKNFREYWESQMLNIAFYEPDYKNLDNLVQTMNQEDILFKKSSPSFVPQIKLLSSVYNFCLYTGVHMDMSQYREVEYISLKSNKPR